MRVLGRIVRAVSLILILLLVLSSCGGNENESFPFVSFVGDDNIVITEYVVVISSDASADVTNAAKDLCERLEDQTGVDTKLVYDSESISAGEDMWQILLGNTKLQASKERLRQMRSEDYTCRSDGRCTVIGGRSDKSTLTAIERFIAEILPVSDEFRPIPNGGGFDYKGIYETECLKIGSAEVSSYEIIVRSVSDSFAVEMAYVLRDKISECFGYYLDVIIGHSSSGRGIYLSSLSEIPNGRAEFEFSGNDIFLSSADKAGLERVSDIFVELLATKGTEGVLESDLPSRLYIPDGNTDCEIGTLSLGLGETMNSLSRYTELVEVLSDKTPDILLCGDNFDSDGFELLDSALPTLSGVGEQGILANDKAENEFIGKYEKDGAVAFIYRISVGNAELLLVYLSVEGSGELEVDISEIVGETPLPIVLMAYSYEDCKLTIDNKDYPFLSAAMSDSMTVGGKKVSFTCYADMSCFEVSESISNSSLGYKQINISLF